jgi:hexosaminidase
VANLESAQLGRELFRSAKVDSSVFLAEDDGRVTGGMAYLTFRNTSTLPLHFEGRFYHNPWVSPEPGSLQLTIPPETTTTTAVTFKAIQPFSPEEKPVLDIDGTLDFRHPEYPDLKLTGTRSFVVRNASFDAIEVETAEFTDSITIALVEPPPGSTLHYTLDGSDPGPGSPVYRKPLVIENPLTLKTCLITEGGYQSKQDAAIFEKVAPGQGLWLHYYENDPEKGRYNRLPDYRELTPKKIQVTQTFDPDAYSRQDDYVGAEFFGTITLPRSGDYAFSAKIDDGFEMRIDDKVVAQDRVGRGIRVTEGDPAHWEAGTYPFALSWFEDRRTRALEVYYSYNGGPRQPIPFAWFRYE